MSSFPLDKHSPSLAFRVRKAPLVAVLWGIPVLLSTLAIAREFVLGAWGSETVLGAMAPLRLEGEETLTNWYSSVLLLFISGLLVLKARIEHATRWRPYWLFLAVIFLYLSIDEAAVIHELSMGPMAQFRLTGAFRMSWVVPYGIACLLLAAIFLPLVLGQPFDLRWSIIIGGAFYVGSALVLEAVEGRFLTAYGWGDPYFQTTMKIQEAGELVGLTIFAIGLFSSLGGREPLEVKVTIESNARLLQQRSPVASLFRSDFGHAYLAAMIFTAVFQIWWRSLQCVGAECAPSFIKGLAWSFIWPIAWMVFLFGSLN